jgi:RNA recognition motif-containing protein
MDPMLRVEPLPFWFTDSDLGYLCSTYGRVLSANIVKDAKGRSLRYGFVEMSAQEEADRLREALNGSELFGYPLRVTRLSSHK